MPPPPPPPRVVPLKPAQPQSVTWPRPLAYVQPLWNWLSRYPILFVVTLVLALVVWNVLLADFGAGAFVWHDSFLQSLAAGLAVAVYLSFAVLVGYILDDRKARREGRRIDWMPYVVFWLILAAAIGLGVVHVRHTYPGSGKFGFLAGLTAVGLVHLSALVMQSSRDEPAGTRVLVAVVGVLAILVCVAMFAAHEARPDFFLAQVTPAVSVCTALIGILAAYLVIMIGLGNTPLLYPVLLAVVAFPFVTAGGLEKENRVPGLEPYWAMEPINGRPRLDKYDDLRKKATGQLSDREVLTAWKERTGESRPTLFVVTCSGGASGSSLFTARLLVQLTLDNPAFADHLRIITGASGGMLGASYYVARLPELREKSKALYEARTKGELSPYEFEKRKEDLRLAFLAPLEQDFLAPLVQKWVFKDMPSYFVPVGTTNDRGLALEKSWSRHLDGALDGPVVGLRSAEKTGSVPSLIFSPMMIEDGRQVLISNLDLDYMVTNGAEGDERTATAVEFFKLFPDADKFKLATAVRLNATFPFLTPTAALPTNPPRSVVDAGYYDNYGATTALAWISQNKTWLRENVSEVVLIQCRAYGNENETSDWIIGGDDLSHAKTKRLGLNSVTAPAAGLVTAWRANMVYRGDQGVRRLRELLNSLEPGLFTARIVECGTNPPLNWTLTRRDIDGIYRDLDTREQVVKVKAWMDTPANRRQGETMSPELKSTAEAMEKKNAKVSPDQSAEELDRNLKGTPMEMSQGQKRPVQQLHDLSKTVKEKLPEKKPEKKK